MRLDRVIVLVAALAAALGTARLGWWQLDRGAQKAAVQRAVEASLALPPLPSAALARDAVGAAAQWHRAVQVQGQWVRDSTRYLDNRPHGARSGFIAVSALRLPDGSAVAVQRGWLPRDPVDRQRVAAPPLPERDVIVDARIAPPPPRLMEFEPVAAGAIRQNLDLDAYARELALPLRPLTLQQLGAPGSADDGLVRDWPRPASDVHKHYGYAFQWFALSALIVGLYVWFQLIRPRRRA